MAVLLLGTPEISEDDIDHPGIDFTPFLDPGEMLDADEDVVIEEIGSADLSFDNEHVSLSTQTMHRPPKEVLSRRAAQFQLSGQLAGKTYRCRITVTTTSVPPRTIVRDFKFTVASESD